MSFQGTNRTKHTCSAAMTATIAQNHACFREFQQARMAVRPTAPQMPQPDLFLGHQELQTKRTKAPCTRSPREAIFERTGREVDYCRVLSSMPRYTRLIVFITAQRIIQKTSRTNDYYQKWNCPRTDTSQLRGRRHSRQLEAKDMPTAPGTSPPTELLTVDASANPHLNSGYSEFPCGQESSTNACIILARAQRHFLLC